MTAPTAMALSPSSCGMKSAVAEPSRGSRIALAFDGYFALSICTHFFGHQHHGPSRDGYPRADGTVEL